MYREISLLLRRNDIKAAMILIEKKLRDELTRINERIVLGVAQILLEKYDSDIEVMQIVIAIIELESLDYGIVLATKLGNIELVKIFLEKEAGIIYRERNMNNKLIEKASIYGHLELVKYLYEMGVKDEESINRAFLYSCENHKFDVADFLIRQQGRKIRKDNIPLRLLVRNDCVEILKLVDKNNISLNHFDINEEMIFACKKGKIETIKILIELGADINYITKYGKNAIIYASINGHLEVIKYLYEIGEISERNTLGADINYETGYGKNAIVYASMHGQLAVVEYLYEIGLRSEFFINIAFLFACENGHFQIAEYLITKGAKVNYADYGDTALMRVSKNGYFEIVNFLLEKGALVNYKKKNGDTALIFALKNNDMRMVTFLIQKGAVLFNDKSSEKMLIDSVLKERIDIVRFLLENKVSPNIRDNRGKTLIELIIGHYKGEAILLELIKNKVELSILDSEKNSYLISAINNNLPKIAKELIENKIDINQKNIYGGDALISASRHGNLEIINLLIKNGANINSLKNNKTNALFALLYKDKSALLMREIFRCLIENGINLLQRNTNFETPMEIVFKRGDFNFGMDILDYMIKAGIDPYETNDKGEDLFYKLSKVIKDYSKYLQVEKILLEIDRTEK